ncbi:MAG: hypothetical protein ACKOUT_12360 [Novosphingobium sp.]
MSRKPTSAPIADWMTLAGQSWMLMGEAASVIWLRSWKIAGGGKGAQSEAVRMVSEKVAAQVELGMEMMTRPMQSPEAATRASLKHYRAKVRSNRRRLSR